MGKPWVYQKKLQVRGDVPTIGDIRQWVTAIKNKRDRFLIALTYLTAGRIREVIGIRPNDITRVRKNGRDVIFIHMMNEKSKRRTFKDIAIPIDGEPLTGIILGYIDSREASSMGLLGFKTRYRGWQIFHKYGCNPHWMRHIRLTHLVTVYDFNDQLLIRYAGWASSKEAKHYMELRWHDFLDRM